MAGKKISKPRTPAERDTAQGRTKSRKDKNREANRFRATINASDNVLVAGSKTSILTPGPRKSNGGNGSPIRLAQVKRALSRVGKPQQEDK